MKSKAYIKLEKVLRAADRPLSCYDLFDHLEVRRDVRDAKQISDMLGYMWRQGRLQRVPAPLGQVPSPRFAYVWRKDPPEPKPQSVEEVTRPRIGKLEVINNKDGSVTLVTKEFDIVIRKKA